MNENEKPYEEKRLEAGAGAVIVALISLGMVCGTICYIAYLVLGQ